MKLLWTAALAAGVMLAGCSKSDESAAPAAAAAKHRVIIFVWDGLRPDSINSADTPNLLALRDVQGANFTDNHSTFPTFTMMNAASFATGSFPGTTGFYGNTLYQPVPACSPPTDSSSIRKKTCATSVYGANSGGSTNNFVQPVFTEDYAILDDLQSFYAGNGQALLNAATLFQAAQAAGLKTAAIGKTGPAYLQDYLRGGVFLDEAVALPASLATGLQNAGFPLPKRTTLSPYYFTYSTATAGSSTITLASSNGDPTAGIATTKTNDGITVDPRSTVGSQHNAANQYLMDAFVSYILPTVQPDLALIWFRTPDSTEHAYGPGSPNYHNGLQSQDALLGELLDALAAQGLIGTTDLIIANDHGHNIVAGDPAFFPMRAMAGDTSSQTGYFVGVSGSDPNYSAATTTTDSKGYPVSGDVRTADLLSQQGITNVYDGGGCLLDPVHSGIKADGSQVYPTQSDTTGSVCGNGTPTNPVTRYSTPSYVVPASLPATATVIAANGGSDYLYLPDHSASRLQSIVTVLQQREEYGAIFVNSRYCQTACPNGTLPMTNVKLENATSTSTPDIVVSFNFDETYTSAINFDLPGREYESFQGNWGMHGSFSPIDVHNTLIAAGPDFIAGYRDTLPTGNVDVAPTVARILGLSLPAADGRVLTEALKGDTTPKPTVTLMSLSPATAATSLTFQSPVDPKGATADAAFTSGTGTYTFTVKEKVLKDSSGKTFTYFDSAKPSRS